MNLKLSTITLAVIILGGVVAGMYGFMIDLADDTTGYGVSYDSSYLTTFDKTTNMSNQMTDKYNEIKNFTAKTSTAIQIITLVPDVLSLIKDIITLPFDITVALIMDLTELFGLPGWVTAMMLGILATIIVYAFISYVLRWKS